MGLGVEYGAHPLLPEEFEAYALRHYPPSPAMQKTLQINRSTLISQRRTALPLSHPHLNGPAPAPVEASISLFLSTGVALAASAARRALSDWGGSVGEITHLVCVTVCASSNPGFDHYLASSLGLPSVQKTLLHGIGCTGGLALLRHAAQLVLAGHVMGQKVTVLCVAAEMASLYYRHALEDVHRLGVVSPAVTLFADGAGAFVVSSCPAPIPAPSTSTPALADTLLPQARKPIYTLRAYTTLTLPLSTSDLSVNLSSTGYNASLSRSVPLLTGQSFPPILSSLQRALGTELEAGEMDWALHPGGAAIVKSVQKAAGVPEERLKAVWEVYGECGNMASATVVGVLQALRGWGVEGAEGAEGRGRRDVLATAFGPGVGVEMIMLRRG
ncbi:thiolase-like protein [Calocera viscosa TUFC12733]|uniref:Thiolase-like protein n=1 Tax=Calocera viscosa (strain TUFC12733) TaxID=1330018 RepID=A0A167LZZ0_CALVF|nr:thiolase-like protein [Calocera viscosa TUFC12733]